MKQIEIIRTALDNHTAFNNGHVHHEEDVNNRLKSLQADCNYNILNVSTISNKYYNHFELITTIYFDAPTD